MGNDFDILLGEATKLVEVAESVQERVRPWVAAACRVGGFRVPKRLSRLELVAELPVESQGLVGAPEPLLRERCVGRGLLPHGRTALRRGAVVVIREGVDVSGLG